MASRARVGFLAAGLFACVWFLCGAPNAHSADSASPITTDKTNADSAPLVSPTFQEQQDLVQQAIEQTRREADAAAKRNEESLARRLDLFQQSLETQQQRALDALHNSNRTTLTVAGVLAGVGLIGLFCVGFFLTRTTNRLTELFMAASPAHALGPGPAPNALTAGPAQLNPAEQAGARFLGAIAQLEKRLEDFEHTAQHVPAPDGSTQPNGQPKSGAPEPAAKTESAAPQHKAGNDTSTVPDAAAESGDAAHLALLLAKGQTLLSLDKPAEALACFDDMLALDSRNAEAHVKKGTALEKLRRLEEAVECYDRAITLDGSLTTAYLYKGGVFNRLQRFEEALKCYEQALETGQKALDS